MPDHRRSPWTPLAPLATLILVTAVTGCSSPPTNNPDPDDIDQGIRTFDFRNTLWLDYSTLSGTPILLNLKLKNGRFEGKIDSPSRQNETLKYEIFGSPAFADVDDDGDEDAALALQSADQGMQLSWYMWVWQDGSAQQLHYPFYRHSRCDAAQTEVHPAESGFQVSTSLKSQKDTCAAPPMKKLQYFVSARNGYPIRIHPAPSAPDRDCFSEDMQKAVIRNPIAAKVAPEEAAPEIGEPEVYGRVEVSVTHEEFLLARLTTDERTVCGWVRRSAFGNQALEE